LDAAARIHRSRYNFTVVDEMGKPAKVLLFENDRAMLDRIRKTLQREKFEVAAFSDYGSAWSAYTDSRYAIVITCGSPFGVQFCRRLREVDVSTPMILIGGNENGLEISEALELGCDDYILKPLDALELVTRVRMVMGRMERMVKTNPGRLAKALIRMDELVIDPLKRLVTISGKPVCLTVKEFDLLVLLASNRGRIYSRRELLNLLWDCDSEVYEHTVNSHMNRLRAKIEKNPRRPKYILTVWGIGYRFTEAEP
jgi:DNA-binding response OmpR family regulator